MLNIQQCQVRKPKNLAVIGVWKKRCSRAFRKRVWEDLEKGTEYLVAGFNTSKIQTLFWYHVYGGTFTWTCAVYLLISSLTWYLGSDTTASMNEWMNEWMKSEQRHLIRPNPETVPVIGSKNLLPKKSQPQKYSSDFFSTQKPDPGLI